MDVASLAAISSAVTAPDDGPGIPWAQGLAAPAAGPRIDFARIFEQEAAQVSTDLRTAETAMQDYAAGKPVELHDLMIKLERARISVQVFVQVRNKVVESYQDLMRMQT
jgi:flagellar hook-basal body complex protein FliE